MALYQYTPSQPLAIVALVLFAITTIYHAFQLFHHKAWFFIPFLIGGIFEVCGYAARLSSMQTPDELTPYIAQTLLLLLPPVLFSASIYMTLKKIIVAMKAEEYSLLSMKRLTPTFVWLDCISLLIQGTGGGLLGAGSDGTSNLPDYGQWIAIVGLAVQLIAFSFFLYVAARFHRRINESGLPALSMSQSLDGRTSRLGWAQGLYSLYISGGLIMIRSVYRVAEFATGHEGYLMSHEAYFYIFDSLLMFLVMILFNAIYPAKILRQQMTQLQPKNPFTEQDEIDLEKS